MDEVNSNLENMTDRVLNQNLCNYVVEESNYFDAETLAETLDISNMPIVFLENDQNIVEFDQPDLLEASLQDKSNDVSNNTNDNDVPMILDEPEKSTDKEKTKPRKKLRNTYRWKSELRKTQYQRGNEHINSRKKLVKKREVKNRKDCNTACRYKCSNKLNQEQRKMQFESYYKLDQNGKYHYINKTTNREIKQRSTKQNKEESRRSYSFKNFFYTEGKKIQVCKTFYLSTLDISQKPIYNVHSKKNKHTGVPKKDMRGRLKTKNSISEKKKQLIIDHINSFPTVDSHYCRARTSKKYLESHLNISKMYDLYLEKCENEEIDPLKSSMYRHIFATKFNLGFHMPKSDRCAICEKYTVAKREGIIVLENEEAQYELHVSEKNRMREEKKQDRENEQTMPFLCFDLENVITCPRAEISPLFYFKKLSVYNLTARFSHTKRVYCALWHEYTAGRTGNDIATAFIKILERIVEDNEIVDLITWSDSCVPQNRNSIISFAILEFLKKNPNINSITLKYSIPGHSAIQEVDSAHSAIERVMSKTEFHSPLGLIRLLKTANRKNPYTIIQMKPTDFKDYYECAKLFNYKNVPFASATALRFTQRSFEVQYKTAYSENEYTAVSVKSRVSSSLPKPATLPPIQINSDKREHFIKMIQYMNMQDREYYKILFKITDDEIKLKSQKPNKEEQEKSNGEKTKKSPKKRASQTKNNTKKTSKKRK